jgi:hypothetical protein
LSSSFLNRITASSRSDIDNDNDAGAESEEKTEHTSFKFPLRNLLHHKHKKNTPKSNKNSNKNNQNKRQSQQLFCLQIGCVILLLFEVCWPLEFLLQFTNKNSKFLYGLLYVTTAILFDILLPIILAIICQQILLNYYKLRYKTMNKYVNYAILLWLVCTWFCSATLSPQIFVHFVLFLCVVCL